MLDFPPFEKDTDAAEADGLIWKVYSACSQSGATWDHLSFAFYFPEPNYEWRMPPKNFSVIGKTADRYFPKSRRTNEEIERPEKEREPDSEVLAFLKKKIDDA